MNIKQAIENYLLTYTGLTALIDINLFDDEFPQGFIGRGIAYTTVSAPREIAVIDPGIVHETIQFTVMGITGKDCDDILIQLRHALQDFTGVMGTKGEDIGVQVDCTKCRNSGYNVSISANISANLTGFRLRGADWEFDYHE